VTVTAPLITEELTTEVVVIEADGLTIRDNLPMVIPDSAPIVDEYSILRDPIIPFIIVGVATLLAMIVFAFILSAPVL
jgi:hypothetical protein